MTDDKPFLIPCPICNGVEGCDHTVPERARAASEGQRACTCRADERPIPCERKFTLRDCWRAAVLSETQHNIVALKNRDRQPHEQKLLDYFMRVRNCLEV